MSKGSIMLYICKFAVLLVLVGLSCGKRNLEPITYAMPDSSVIWMIVDKDTESVAICVIRNSQESENEIQTLNRDNRYWLNDNNGNWTPLNWNTVYIWDDEGLQSFSAKISTQDWEKYRADNTRTDKYTLKDMKTFFVGPNNTSL